MKIRRGAIIGFVLGAIVTVPACGIAMVSIGAGHGDTVLARLLYPYSMLLLLLAQLSPLESQRGISVIYALMALVAFAQFPIYGAIIGASGRETSARRRWVVAGKILFIHLIAVAVCFSGTILRFF